jgi:hypothetical protein
MKLENQLIENEEVKMHKAYCGACQEAPCMCSDPEQASTTWGW